MKHGRCCARPGWPLAECAVEVGVGETRAALIEGGRILEAEIEVEGQLRVGAVAEARLVQILVPRRRAIARLAGGPDVLVEPLDAGVTQGALCRVRITRLALPEPGGARKLDRARLVDPDAPLSPGSSLLDRLAGGRQLSPHDPDLLESAGWSELLAEAEDCEVQFPGGSLSLSLTPAMAVIDVDGWLPPPELAVAGARAAAETIRRMALTGPVGIDLPTLSGKVDRQAAAAALDAVLPQPFERTAVNGFGFLQVVRRRERPSIPEVVKGDPVGAAARALLRRAERSRGAGRRTLHCAPAVERFLSGHPDWLARVQRTVGAPVALRAEPGLAISGGHVASQHP